MLHRRKLEAVAAAISLLVAASPAMAVAPTADGSVPTEVVEAMRLGRFDLPPASPLRTSLVGATWKVPVVLVDFTDQHLTYTSGPDWNKALFDTTHATVTGSVFDYYTWVSGRRLRVLGRVVGTVHLPQPKNYYANSTYGLSGDNDHNVFTMADQTLSAIVSQVDWSEFDQDLDGYVDTIWFLHSGMGGEHLVGGRDMWSITSTLTQWKPGSVYFTSSRVPGTTVAEKINAFSVMPELSATAFRLGQRSEIGVFCHEFGHTLGLPDLYDTQAHAFPYNVGPGNWSLMSTGLFGGDGVTPEYPTHIGAWAALYLGWTQSVRPSEDGPMTLGAIENGGPVLDLWFQGAYQSEHYLVENRQKVGFDRNLPGSGLMVYRMNDFAFYSGLPANDVVNERGGFTVVTGDGSNGLISGQRRGDPGDPMPGSSGLTRWDDDTAPSSRSMEGEVTYVALRNLLAVGDSMRFELQVRSPDWQPPRTVSAAGIQPSFGPGRGRRAVMLTDSSLAAVTSEYVGGRAQVIFRSRRPDRTWEPAFQLSASTGSAADPTVAALPGGDVCVVWSDTRNGPDELYYRARVLGTWTAERRLTDLPGYSKSPALGADSRGGVHLAWLYSEGATATLEFMYFPYLMPMAAPRPVTKTGNHPDAPRVAVAPDGSSYVLWPDLGPAQKSLWFAHFTPDSGVRAAQSLVATSLGIKPNVGGAIAPDGRLHYVWLTTGSDGSTVHYASRAGTTGVERTLTQRGEPIQDVDISCSADGGLHVLMEATSGSASQILYQERHVDAAWDVAATEVTRPADGTATQATILPRHPGSATVLYTLFGSGGAGFTERVHGQVPGPITAVANPPPAFGAGWRLLPNPLRAGSPLRLRWEGERPPTGAFQVFDVSGRRIADGRFAEENGRWVAEIPGSATRSWSSGMYFARLRDGSAHARFVVIR